MGIVGICFVSLSKLIYLYIYLSSREASFSRGDALPYLLNLEFPVRSDIVGGHEPLLQTLDSLLAHFLLQRRTANAQQGFWLNDWIDFPATDPLGIEFHCFYESGRGRTKKKQNIPTNKQKVRQCHLIYHALTQLWVCSGSLEVFDSEGQTLFRWSYSETGHHGYTTPVIKLFSPPLCLSAAQPSADYLQSNEKNSFTMCLSDTGDHTRFARLFSTNQSSGRPTASKAENRFEVQHFAAGLPVWKEAATDDHWLVFHAVQSIRCQNFTEYLSQMYDFAAGKQLIFHIGLTDSRNSDLILKHFTFMNLCHLLRWRWIEVAASALHTLRRHHQRLQKQTSAGGKNSDMWPLVCLL